MTKYEKLLDDATHNDVTVLEKFDMSEVPELKGLYCDGSVALSKSLDTEAKKSSILLEELGHHATSSGDIIDINDTRSRKQEQVARMWAYKNAISMSDLMGAYESGCRNRFEIAEYLDITEEFLLEAVNAFKSKYGLCLETPEYIMTFEPFGVFKKL